MSKPEIKIQRCTDTHKAAMLRIVEALGEDTRRGDAIAVLTNVLAMMLEDAGELDAVLRGLVLAYDANEHTR